jgi:transposase, IS30 family
MMGNSYLQLNLDERIEIARLHASGQSRAAIGRLLGRHPSTIGRELTRNSKPTKQWSGAYEGARAHGLAERRRRWDARYKLVRVPALLAYVGEGLAMGWSPAQIAARLAHDNLNGCVDPALVGLSISHESIYRFVYYRSAQKDYWHKRLPRAKARRGHFKRSRRSPIDLIAHRVSIDDRARLIDERERFGDWEGDLMLFSRYGQAVLAVHERRSRLLLLHKQPSKHAIHVFDYLRELFGSLPASLRGSITFDNGTEFALHHRLNTELSMPTYFCDPHAPWQKGGVENAIGRVRRDLPRCTDLSLLSQPELDAIARRYNDTPRQCLSFQTPNEVFMQHFLTLHFKCESIFPRSRE